MRRYLFVSPLGGDTASTGARDFGMRAERHLLVNPVEKTL
jgi:hypothetical protein